MKTYVLLAAAACMVATLQAPARAGEDEESRAQAELRRAEREHREEREKLEKELEIVKDKIREIRIKKSGKRSKDIITLKYGTEDCRIVGVIDNGKVIREEDFPKYRFHLNEALGAWEIDEIRSELERLEEIIDSPRRSDQQKIEALREIIEELKDARSETASLAREIYRARLGALGGGRFVFDLSDVRPWFESCGSEMTILVLKDGCYVNGEKLPPELSERLLELINEYREQLRAVDEAGESGDEEK